MNGETGDHSQTPGEEQQSTPPATSPPGEATPPADPAPKEEAKEPA